MQNNISDYENRSSLFVWFVVLAVLGIFFYVYRYSINVLLNYWNDYGTYSHGYLTVLLSMFLIYSCVKQEQFSYSRPSVLCALGAFVISLVWLVAYVASINTVQMLCIPFFIFFTISYFCGLNNYRILIVPVFILLFTVPIWSATLPLLQELAVNVTNKLLSVSSLEYLVVDNRVIFSKGIFQIEESCSGLRYLLVGVLLAVVYGFLNYESSWSTLFLILSTVVIMLIANFVRILVIIALGVYKGMDHPMVQDHENLGWVLFALFLIPMFVIARYLNPNIWSSKNTPSERSSVGNKNIASSKLVFASEYPLRLCMQVILKIISRK